MDDDEKMLEAIVSEEGQFRYRNVPTNQVNRHGIIRMRFHECDKVTFGVFGVFGVVEKNKPKPVDSDILTVEEEYDWSKVSFSC
jgi:hypothetical protein